jgi:hypothetical protein
MQVVSAGGTPKRFPRRWRPAVLSFIVESNYPGQLPRRGTSIWAGSNASAEKTVFNEIRQKYTVR